MVEQVGAEIRRAVSHMDNAQAFWAAMVWFLIAGVIVSVLVGIAGCSTPVTMLKNDVTGQVAHCGGDSSGSMMGGVIGYSIQKNDAEKCVLDYESQGFKRVPN